MKNRLDVFSTKLGTAPATPFTYQITAVFFEATIAAVTERRLVLAKKVLTTIDNQAILKSLKSFRITSKIMKGRAGIEDRFKQALTCASANADYYY